VMSGVSRGPLMRLPPGASHIAGSFRVPHLGAVGRTPDHTFVIYPDGTVGQRFDTDSSRYTATFPNMGAFRHQEFPLGSGRYPYARSTIDIYCPNPCVQHRRP
jgi:hypothetical protein